jgi:hypothetical protein
MGSATARLPQVVTGRTMQRSKSKKILTTHVGSLPRPNGTDRPGGEDDADLPSWLPTSLRVSARPASM